MPVNLELYRWTVGVFSNREYVNTLQYEKCFFLNRILLFTLEYDGIIFYVIGRLY